ncbi:MAG: hypothetical protein RIQ81_1101 [Pseudomonadota bacterium]
MQQIDPMARDADLDSGEVLDATSLLARHGLPASFPGSDAPVSAPAALVRWLLVGAGATGKALCLGGAQSNNVVALEQEEVALGDVLDLVFSPGAVLGRWPEARAGVVVVLSYDDLAGIAYQESGVVIRELKREGRSDAADGPSPSFARKILSAVRVNASRSLAALSCAPGRERQAMASLDVILDAAGKLAGQPDFLAGVMSTPQLFPEAGDAAYLRAVEEVIHQIREGRWYQLNMLRFFKLDFSDGMIDGVLDGVMPPGWFAWRMDSAGGSWSAMVDGASARIMCLSPERFTSVLPDANGAWLHTYPVKGTIPRDLDPMVDRRNAEMLLRSRKDLAELHMIVDLMRNDFHRIAGQHPVTVPVEQVVRSHANVHHLHAEVRSRISPDVSFASLVGAICPAGSITGTPKLEVIKGIRELEGRPRGYHMGNLFYWQPDGRLDSSVLIRTITSPVPGRRGAYELAAGSGIVVHSNPESELAEVMAKARIATAPLSQFAGCP